MMHWRDYTGKEVVVYSQGTTYSGRMIEMTDEYVLLRADTGHCQISMDKVTSIDLVEGSAASIMSPSPLSGFNGGDDK